MAAQKIVHPVLGEFTRRGDWDHWTGRISMPTWANPPFSDVDSKEDLKGKIELTICEEQYGEKQVPTPAQVAAVVAVREAEILLAEVVLNALWDSFTGAGPNRGYWWHANLKEVNEILECWKSGPVVQKEDLLRHFYLQSVGVGRQYETAVELTLYANWEIEHGVGVLVEGGKVIGIGYSGEAEPW